MAAPPPDAESDSAAHGMRRRLAASARRTRFDRRKAKAAALRHGLARILEAGRARLTSVYRSRTILAIDAR